MKYIQRAFKEGDFIKIRDFLQASREYSQANWLIERWNFCRYYGIVSLNKLHRWKESVAIWEDEQSHIVAVVNSEDDSMGDAYFQLGNIHHSVELISEMLDFAENKLAVMKDDQRKVSLRVNKDWQLHELLKNRGYVRQQRIEMSSKMDTGPDLPVVLPDGFRIVNAHEVSAEQQGLAHGRAFRHSDDTDFVDLEWRISGYQSLRMAPDYRPELDFAVLSPEGEIASFATVWYDCLNQIGIFEPVGTVPKYRRKGLGRALLYAATNQMKASGVTRMYVGSDQKFYLDIGFEPDTTYDEVWHKIW